MYASGGGNELRVSLVYIGVGRLARGFFQHRGLIVFSVGGAVAETALLSWLGPGARALGPQVTALPPLASYHDLRWLFAFGQSWPAFVALLVAVLIARSALDAVFVLLAWPTGAAVARPRFMAAFWSSAVLTVLVWAVLSPVATLMFGVALVPFSWPFLAAVPILLGSALMLSHGGVGQSWWRRLPAASTAGWLLTGFLALSAVAAAQPHLDAAEFLGVAVLAGLLNARAWYGLTVTAVKHARTEAPQAWHWRIVLWEARQVLRRRTSWVPVAPVAALLVIVAVAGLARLTFTGTVHLAPEAAAGAGVALGSVGLSSAGQVQAVVDQAAVHAAVLVVGGFGSNCCNDAKTLAAQEPGMLIRQFSYLGLNAAGQPISYHQAADLPIQELGDRIALQVEWLQAHADVPVTIVAESEGTLGLYAMLARHPGLRIQSAVLLSPIVEPGQVGPSGVPGAALLTLNNLIGKMSPYGPSGAQALIDSVGEVGARYFSDISRDPGFRWLSIVPLADAVTLPTCPYPPNVVVVQAFHGGLLGDPQVSELVADFLAGHSAVPSSQRLRTAAQVISAAASAWRMPDLHPACPGG
jgi:hypothetical protein